MLSETDTPFMFSVIMLTVVMLTVVMLTVVILTVVILAVVAPSRMACFSLLKTFIQLIIKN